MMPGGGSGAPPPPAPAPDYPGAVRRMSPEFPGGRKGTASPERRGRSRTAERPRQGPVRRIRSSGPAGPLQPPEMGEQGLWSQLFNMRLGSWSRSLRWVSLILKIFTERFWFWFQKSIIREGVTADNVMEMHRAQERRMYTCAGYRDRERGERRHREAGDMVMVREMEDLRARTQQMEKTLK